MTDQECRQKQVEYDEWAKTRRLVGVEWDHVKERPDGTVTVLVRVCRGDVRVGDWFGGAEVLSCHAYEKSLDSLPEGMTGALVLSRRPSVVMEEEHPDFIEWLKANRDRRAAQKSG